MPRSARSRTEGTPCLPRSIMSTKLLTNRSIGLILYLRLVEASDKGPALDHACLRMQNGGQALYPMDSYRDTMQHKPNSQ